ncbi:MAG: nucleotide exchange factor GrpE [Opitutae bacterium]
MDKQEDLTNSENDKSNSTDEEVVKDEQELEETPSNLKNQLSEAYSKHESLQSKYLRTFADLENLKKRSIRDREEAIQRTRLQIIEDLLPVIDAFKMGMDEAQKADPEGPVVNGFKMAINQMQTTLEDYGLVCIEGIGEPFDPKFHDAIGHEAGDDDDMILQVIRKGYRLRDHLLRPASVIVSKRAMDESGS